MNRVFSPDIKHKTGQPRRVTHTPPSRGCPIGRSFNTSHLHSNWTKPFSRQKCQSFVASNLQERWAPLCSLAEPTPISCFIKRMVSLTIPPGSQATRFLSHKAYAVPFAISPSVHFTPLSPYMDSMVEIRLHQTPLWMPVIKMLLHFITVLPEP